MHTRNARVHTFTSMMALVWALGAVSACDVPPDDGDPGDSCSEGAGAPGADPGSGAEGSPDPGDPDGGAGGPTPPPGEDPDPNYDAPDGPVCQADSRSAQLMGFGWGSLHVAEMAPQLIAVQPCSNPDGSLVDTGDLELHLNLAVGFEARAEEMAEDMVASEDAQAALALASLGRRKLELRLSAATCNPVQKAIVCAKYGKSYLCQSDSDSLDDIKTMKKNGCKLWATNGYECPCDLEKKDEC